MIFTENPTHKAFVDPANSVKMQLRLMISDWCIQHPDRLFTRISMNMFDELRYESLFVRLAIMHLIDGAVDTTLPKKLEETPHTYELHVILPAYIEVLIQRKELEEYPVRAFAKEVSLIAREQAKSIDIDEVFDFRVPESILSRVMEMSYTRRSRFKTKLECSLVGHGFSFQGGSVAGGFQIRRNR